jgi:hypothetical protein
MQDLITVKHASRLFDLPVQSVHYLLRTGKIDGVQVGTAGPGWYSGKDGKLVYHNLVSVSSIERHIRNKVNLRKIAEIPTTPVRNAA